jgi:hypothetical protein
MENSTSLSGGKLITSSGNPSVYSLTVGISLVLKLGSELKVNMMLKHLLLRDKYWIIWWVFCSRAVRALLSTETSVGINKFFSAQPIYTILAESQFMPNITSISFRGRDIRSI